MAFNTVSTAPYLPSTTNDHSGHNSAVAAFGNAINNHNHDPSSSTGNYGNSVPAWGSANPIYSAHGPGGVGSDWASAFNGAAAIPADPTETAVNPSTNATIAQGTPGASITASWGVHGELARIRGALALMKGASANWFDAVTLFVDPSTQAGDLIYRNGSNVSTPLHVGTNGMVLGLVGGLPTWITNAAGFADPTTTAGDLIYKNGSGVTTRFPVGANGTVLGVVGGLPAYITNPAGFADPTTTAGDLIYRNGSGVTTRFPIGSNGNVLGIVGGLPAWITNVAGFSDPTTTAGDLIYKNGSGVTTRFPVGSNGTFLQVVAGLPSYAAISASSLPVATVAAAGATEIDANPASGTPIAATQPTVHEQIILPGYVSGGTSGNTAVTFNANGTITTVHISGVTETTTFNSNGSITSTFTGGPLGATTRTKTTTFGATTITETVS